MIKTVDALLSLWAEQSTGASQRLGRSGIGICAMDVDKAVEALPDDLRECVRAYYFGGAVESGKGSELKKSGMYRRLHRAHEAIAKSLRLPISLAS